jgi:hypothetical protein
MVVKFMDKSISLQALPEVQQKLKSELASHVVRLGLTFAVTFLLI